MFNFAIWALKKWLIKNDVKEAVFIISAYGWSFDDYDKHKDVLEA